MLITKYKLWHIDVLQINELVDARDLNMGAWFEAQIVNVTKTPKSAENESMETDGEDEIRYHIKYEEWAYFPHIFTSLWDDIAKRGIYSSKIFTDRFEEFTNKMAVESAY